MAEPAGMGEANGPLTKPAGMRKPAPKPIG